MSSAVKPGKYFVQGDEAIAELCDFPARDRNVARSVAGAALEGEFRIGRIHHGARKRLMSVGLGDGGSGGQKGGNGNHA